MGSRYRAYVRPLLVIAFCSGPLTTCGSNPTAPLTYTVIYQIVTTGIVTVDSVKYDDGSGNLVTVTAPDTPWQVSFGVPAGGSVAARAWGLASPTSTLWLRADWVASGVSQGADSAGFTVGGNPQPFSLTLPKRTL